MQPQQRLLHHVLGLGDAAEHPVGDGEGRAPQVVAAAPAHAASYANP
jgi:hypothetical protein